MLQGSAYALQVGLENAQFCKAGPGTQLRQLSVQSFYDAEPQSSAQGHSLWKFNNSLWQSKPRGVKISKGVGSVLARRLKIAEK